ncbi:MAG: haloacid dehalogenase [Dehalococcoidia bacterium]
MNTDGLGDIADRLRRQFDAKHAAREQALSLGREVIRLSANAIRAVHRREFEAAEALIGQARGSLEQVERALAEHRDIHHAGYVQDAYKEYAEASCTLALIAGRALPSPEELGVGGAPYLNGLAETIGELRRHLLDNLRDGEVGHCEEALSAMNDIYDVLVTMDYPEAVTGGLRRTTDAMRGILERTRGDFTMASVQRQLEDRLGQFEKRLNL